MLQSTAFEASLFRCYLVAVGLFPLGLLHLGAFRVSPDIAIYMSDAPKSISMSEGRRISCLDIGSIYSFSQTKLRFL